MEKLPEGSEPQAELVAYEPLNLAALSQQAAAKEPTSEEVTRLTEQCMRGASRIKGAKHLMVSGSIVSIQEGDASYQLTLIRDRGKPDVTYVVPADRLHPDHALFCINQFGMAFGPKWQGGAFLDPQQVLEVLRRLDRNRLILKQRPRRRFRLKPLSQKTKLRIAAFTGTLATISTAAVMAIVVFSAVEVDPHTTEPMQRGEIIAANDQESGVPWTEQYDQLKLRNLHSDTGSQIPMEPRKINPPASPYLDNCNEVERDIREGQQFRVAFRGEGDDHYTIRIDHQNNLIVVCREDSQHGALLDSIVIQRVK